VLEAHNLTKTYDAPSGPLTVLSDVSFSLAPGDSAAIMGPSGSGKSSLLYVVGGLEPPTGGVVRLDDQDPYTLNPAALAAFRNAKVGFVFQDHCLLPQCTVLENVLVPTLVGVADRAAPDRARRLLDQVGLAGRLDHHPAALSGGEKQRVAIARALIRQPHLLLCDEPTGNLDRTAAGAVASLLLDLHAQHETILVVVTHSVALADRFPVRYEMDGGRLRHASDSGGP
jgi:lipoprotein-releasing system ATP-binding protein